MPKFGYFGSRSIKFFNKNNPISNVLISSLTLVLEMFETKSPNMGILDKNYQLSNLKEILPVLDFKGVHFKFDICFWKF